MLYDAQTANASFTSLTFINEINQNPLLSKNLFEKYQIYMIFIFYFGKTYLENSYGIFLEGYSLKNYDIKIIIAIVITSLLATIIPAIQIYRNTLRDGLSVKS